MSETTAQLMATFESLPRQEQHELLTEMLRRSGELPATLLADDDLVGLADELFQALDAEESNGSKSGAQ
jgi:hypothetical protein